MEGMLAMVKPDPGQPFCPSCGRFVGAEDRECRCGYETDDLFPSVSSILSGSEDGSCYGDVDLGLVGRRIKQVVLAELVDEDTPRLARFEVSDE